MNSPLEQVIASYHRARRSNELFDTFYDLFLRKAPEIPPMFFRTDFTHQKLMLRQSLLEMLIFAQMNTGRDEIDHLAERHRQLNVKSQHYDLWLDALCESLAQHDPQFSPELERMWRNAMQPGIEVMRGNSSGMTKQGSGPTT
jgi:hemoglobin-like flavoprotein